MERPAVITSWAPANGVDLADSDFLGGKAAGLFKVPEVWVPPFVVLTAEFVSRLADADSAIDALRSLAPSELDGIYGLFSRLGSLDDRLLVRSNAREEGESFVRGLYDSEANVEPQIERLAEAIDRVAAQDHGQLNLVVQRQVQHGQLGHMSNARRVSDTAAKWLVETAPPLRTQVYERIRSVAPVPEEPLSATVRADVLHALRRVAGHLNSTFDERCHCEWVWDGDNVWVVQVDEAPSVQTSPFADSYLQSVDEEARAEATHKQVIRSFRDGAAKWRKLRRPKNFERLGWPTATLYLLTADAWGDPETREEALEDLRPLIQDGLVIRCDVSEDVAGDDMLLPTSPLLRDPDVAASFMDRTVEELGAAGIEPPDLSFLFAGLVAARASAMVRAHPKGRVVRVDTTWGFPDGLSFVPHDTHIVTRDRKIKTSKRCKSHCYLPHETEWALHELGEPYDWRRVLSDEEILHLADWGRKMADLIDSEVQLMCLARVGGARGPEACLPWHYTSHDVPPYSQSEPYPPRREGAVDVRNREDLAALANATGFIEQIWIRPDSEHIRDRTFIQDVASAASGLGIPLLFEGSLLGHAYFLMKSQGAQVIPISPANPELDRATYDKLVRDRIPLVIQRAGGVARIETVDSGEARTLLTQKLIEESFEVWVAGPESVAEELADVLEVVDALAKHFEISRQELDELQDRKRNERGGFDELLFLRESSYKSLGHSGADGRLPLDVGAEAVSPRFEPSGQRLVRFGEGSAPDGALTFSVPLVPPVYKGHRRSRIQGAAAGMVVLCDYDGSDLVVTVRRERGSKSPSSNQLTLFDEPQR